MKGQEMAMARVITIAQGNNNSIHEEELKNIFGHVPTFYVEGGNRVSFHKDVGGWYWCKFNGHSCTRDMRKVTWH